MKLRKKLIIHKGWVNCLSTSPDKLFLSTGSSDTTIKLIKKDRLLLTLTGHHLPVTAISFSTSGPFLHSSSRSLITHDLTKNVISREYVGHSSLINAIAEGYLNNSDIIASAAECVNVYDRRSKKCVLSVGKDATSVDIVKGKMVYGARDGGIRIYDRGFVYAEVMHVRPVMGMMIVESEYLRDVNFSEEKNCRVEIDNKRREDYRKNGEEIIDEILKNRVLESHCIISLSSTRLVFNKVTARIFNKMVDIVVHDNRIYVLTVDGEIYSVNSLLNFDYECSGEWITKGVSYDNKIVTGGECIQYFF